MGEKSSNNEEIIAFIDLPGAIRQAKAERGLKEITKILDQMVFDEQFFKENTFVPRSLIEGITDESMFNDMKSLRYVLATWLVDNPEKMEASLKEWIMALPSKFESDADVCEKYKKEEPSGYDAYCDFVDRLIIFYGVETVASQFGKYIRNRVPSYALEKLDEINVKEVDEAIVYILSNYPTGFAKRYFSEKQIIDGLEKIEKISFDDMALQGVTTTTMIDYACRHGYLSKPNAEEVITDLYFLSDDTGEYDEYEDLERAIVRWFVNEQQEIPIACVKAIGSEKVDRYKNEIELEKLQQESGVLDDTLELAEKVNGDEARGTC